MLRRSGRRRQWWPALHARSGRPSRGKTRTASVTASIDVTVPASWPASSTGPTWQSRSAGSCPRERKVLSLMAEGQQPDRWFRHERVARCAHGRPCPTAVIRMNPVGAAAPGDLSAPSSTLPFMTLLAVAAGLLLGGTLVAILCIPRRHKHFPEVRHAWGTGPSFVHAGTFARVVGASGNPQPQARVLPGLHPLPARRVRLQPGLDHRRAPTAT